MYYKRDIDTKKFTGRLIISQEFFGIGFLIQPGSKFASCWKQSIWLLQVDLICIRFWIEKIKREEN